MRPSTVAFVVLALAVACHSGTRASHGGATPDAADTHATTTHTAPSDEASTPDATSLRHAAPADGVANADAADAGGATLGPDGFIACGAAPPGMVCISGGPFVRGTDDGPADEHPRAEITVSTFFIDRTEVTTAAYRECMAAGACALMHHYAGFNEADQPVVAVNWINAAAYCAWAGKRLPTEAEWEKAARGTDGRTYPWGEDPPTCERAQYRDCQPRASRPVGSYAPGTWGLVDMAGNAYEFVQDWYSPCYRGCPDACGDACFGRDPRGPCNGAEPCPGREKRVLRGGSWFWPADLLRSAGRRGMRPESGGHRLGFRCAVDDPPPGPVGPPPAPPDPVAPLSATERAAFLDVPEEQLEQQPVDARHWVRSNEKDHALWFATVDRLGGAYVGVGADQNYSLFAAARSTFVWLMDYDPVVLEAHRIYRALILASSSPQEFLLRWDPFERAVTLALLAAACPDSADLPELRRLLDTNFAEAGHYFRNVAARTVDGAPGSWLADPALYRYVRLMFAEDRVRIVAGDLRGDMPGRIADAQHALGVPVRVVYLSNAEQYFDYDDAFRGAFARMPFDGRSVILRTVSRWVPDHSRRVWQFQVEPAAHFEDALRGGLARFADIEEQASYAPDGGLSWLGAVPAAGSAAAPAQEEGR